MNSTGRTGSQAATAGTMKLLAHIAASAVSTTCEADFFIDALPSNFRAPVFGRRLCGDYFSKSRVPLRALLYA
jgi:hypothetical protein